MTCDFVTKAQTALWAARRHVVNALPHANDDETRNMTVRDLSAIDEAMEALIIAGALAKLTPEERKALGY